MHKRLAALLLSLVMVVTGCLTGCGDSKNVEKESSKDNAASTEQSKTADAAGSTEEAEELEPVTLKWWLPAAKTEDSDKIEDAVNAHLAEVLPNTTVEIEWVAISEWTDRWSKAMAAQETIDVSWFGYRNVFETEVSMGSLMVIEDLVAEYGQGIVEVLSQVVLDNHRSLDGQMYFIPAWQGLSTGRYAISLPHENVALLGDKWAKDFQDSLYENWQTPPWELESKQEVCEYVEQYLEASKNAGMLGHGYQLRAANHVVHRIFNSAISGRTGSSGGYTVWGTDDTFYIYHSSLSDNFETEMYTLLHDWYEKGYIRQDIASADVNVALYTLDSKGNNYITKVGNGILDSNGETESVNAGYEIDSFFIEPKTVQSKGLTTGAVIPATSENPERAMMLLNLLYTDAELYQLLVYGIEGTHYTTNADGTITMPEAVTYTGPANWTLGTCENSLTTDASQLSYYDEVKKVDMAADPNPFLNFTFDAANVSVEVSNMNAVDGEYALQSVVPADNFEDLLKEKRKKLDAAGAEAVFKEFYKQVTAYAQANGKKVEVLGLDEYMD